jgi:hypothetical protein
MLRKWSASYPNLLWLQNGGVYEGLPMTSIQRASKVLFNSRLNCRLPATCDYEDPYVRGVIAPLQKRDPIVSPDSGVQREGYNPSSRRVLAGSSTRSVEQTRAYVWQRLHWHEVRDGSSIAQ